MNYAVIKKNDIANGTGVRVSLFVSGCRHHCKNCFNAEAWDFSYGSPYTEETEKEILDAADHSYISGLSLLGGEPFEPENRPELIKLCRAFRRRFPNKDIWCYSGFTLEQLQSDDIPEPETAKALLAELDILVDGKFVEELKDISLQFRGSKNQRIIKLKNEQ